MPHQAGAEGELRTFDRAAYQAGLAQLRALEQDIAVRSRADDFPCQVRVEILNETPPWPRNDGTEALLAHWSTAAAALGLTV